MTTKKLIKECMGLGISRNKAREIVRIARKEGLTNFDMMVAVYIKILKGLEELFSAPI